MVSAGKAVGAGAASGALRAVVALGDVRRFVAAERADEAMQSLLVQ
jgi:hypothetical protein